MRKFFYLLAVPALALLAACSSPKTPEEVAEAYFEYLNDGEFEKLADLHYWELLDDGGAEKREKMIEDFKSRWEKKTDDDELKKVESLQVEEGEELGLEVAKVEVKLTFANGEEDEKDVSMVKDSKGNWKITKCR